MLSIKKSVLLLLIGMISFGAIAQNEVAILPVYNPSHVQIKVTANGKCLKDSESFDIDNKEVEIKAFSIGNDAGSELVIPEIVVDLVRGGRLIASKTIGETGNISSLLELAKGQDVIRFMVSNIYIKNALEKLELYSLGSVNLLYSIASNTSIIID